MAMADKLADARGEIAALKRQLAEAQKEREHYYGDLLRERADLRARVETLEVALGELVALKALKDGGAEAMRGGNYDARKPKAWASARIALAGKE